MASSTRSSRKRLLEVLDTESLLEENQKIQALQSSFLDKERDYHTKISSLEQELSTTKSNEQQLRSQITSLEAEQIPAKNLEGQLLQQIKLMDLEIVASQKREQELIQQITMLQQQIAAYEDREKEFKDKIAELEDELMKLKSVLSQKMKEHEKLKQEADQRAADGNKHGDKDEVEDEDEDEAEDGDNDACDEGGEEDETDDEEVELLPAVKVRKSVMHGLPKDNISLLIRRLVDVLFTKDEQKIYSTTGKKGKTGPAKPPLPEERFAALSAYVHKIFPGAKRTHINQLVNNKLRDTSLKE